MTYKNTILTQQLEASKKRIEDYKIIDPKAAREFENDLLPTPETVEEPAGGSYFPFFRRKSKDKTSEKPAKLIRQHLQEIKKTIIALERTTDGQDGVEELLRLLNDEFNSAKVSKEIKERLDDFCDLYDFSYETEIQAKEKKLKERG
ncbi:14805_t:CDS:2 [Racocetra persica]|uniref:14805_t:CDS:1 n=1 Tax=Racocetra persica TaxID=160502 RepID=A0ACA9RSQ0_9GLOM|nr:14805_t:CDS:2 [Racocetra persica]